MAKKNILWIVLILSTTVLCSCNRQENHFKSQKIENIEDAQCEILRMDKEIYEIDKCITRPIVQGDYSRMTVNVPTNDSICIANKVNQLATKYKDKFYLYLRQLGAMTGDFSVPPVELFYLFISHPAYNELYKDCEKEFEDVSDLEKNFTQAFSRAKTFIPSFRIPKVCTVFSGFAEYIAADSTTAYISCEYFLGADYKNYNSVPGIYDYMIPNLRREKIVPDVLYHWICSEYQMQKEAGNLLDNMIHYGKMIYIVEALLPETDRKVLIGYNEDQWQWCENNEKQMWNYLREYNQLFSTDSKVISDYLYPANCTKYFSTETLLAPPQTGLWVGWRIVTNYMKCHKELSINDLLMNNIDAQTILQESGYRP